MSTKTVKDVIAAAFVGKRVRFPGLTQQFEREEVHTIEKVHFSADEFEEVGEDDADAGVGICFETSKAPGFGGATQTWVYYELAGRIEFVAD
jgi:hypothetical protein